MVLRRHWDSSSHGFGAPMSSMGQDLLCTSAIRIGGKSKCSPTHKLREHGTHHDWGRAAACRDEAKDNHWAPAGPTAKMAELLACEDRADTLLNVSFSHIIWLASLQLNAEAIQKPLEEVLCGCIHHLALDLRSVRRPAAVPKRFKKHFQMLHNAAQALPGLGCMLFPDSHGDARGDRYSTQ